MITSNAPKSNFTVKNIHNKLNIRSKSTKKQKEELILLLIRIQREYKDITHFKNHANALHSYLTNLSKAWAKSIMNDQIGAYPRWQLCMNRRFGITLVKHENASVIVFVANRSTYIR